MPPGKAAAELGEGGPATEPAAHFYFGVVRRLDSLHLSAGSAAVTPLALSALTSAPTTTPTGRPSFDGSSSIRTSTDPVEPAVGSGLEAAALATPAQSAGPDADRGAPGMASGLRTLSSACSSDLLPVPAFHENRPQVRPRWLRNSAGVNLLRGGHGSAV